MATLTTPVMGLPYPDGAERVMDGDNAIGALAAAVDTPLGRLWNPGGIVVGGPARTLVAVAEKLPLSSTIYGSAVYFDDANDQIVIPAGGGGLYVIWAYGLLTIPTQANGFARLSLRSANGASVQVGTNVATIGATVYWNLMGVLSMADAANLQVWGEGAAGNLPTYTVSRFGVNRIGNAFGPKFTSEDDDATTRPAAAEAPFAG